MTEIDHDLATVHVVAPHRDLARALSNSKTPTTWYVPGSRAMQRTLPVVAAFLIVGVLLVGVAGLWVLADWGGLSQRMPTQVLPRRAAWFPFAAGLALIVTGLVFGLSGGLDW